MIANRGEIAIRIARTARAMGIGTVGIYSPDDSSSLHLKYMDELCILPQSGVAGYLDYRAIVGLAVTAGCDAVHPGYGLLSERVELAQECQAHGVTFVGPTPETLKVQGDKVAARALAEALGIAVINGSPPLQDAQAAQLFFEASGCAPMMLKAVNGGGGRGMRVVDAADKIATALDQCRAEALAAFGDDTIYAERFLPSVRHIEVQIIGDGLSVTHLWERDCSVQRRNQKLIELAPAPNLDPETRSALLSAAVAIGRACNYRGLGTIEFLVETDAHGGEGVYFIETNPRIQVEHTITEEITGYDLVEIQLRIAGGETLAQVGLNVDAPEPPLGSAVQLRVNAEVFREDGQLVPSGGTLSVFSPPSGPGVRIDSYGYLGYKTNPNFDSLLAKVIVCEKSVDLARLLKKAENALSEFHVDGVETNIGFLRSLMGLPDLQDWSVNVRSVDNSIQTLRSLQKGIGGGRFFDPSAQQNGVRNPGGASVPEGVLAIKSPMQAVVHTILVAPGEAFSKGQEIAVIEAMKMQHAIVAAAGGIVCEVFVGEGDVIDTNAIVLTYEAGEDLGQIEIAEAAADPSHIRADLKALQDRLALTLDASRPKAVQRRRDRSQRTTRENIADLCAAGDFHEYGQLLLAGQRRKLGVDHLIELSPADGIVTGIGRVNADSFDETSSQVAILAYDSTVMAGTQGFAGHKKTDRMIELAHKQGLASIFLTEGGGGRPNDDDFSDIMHSALNITTFSAYAGLQGRGPKVTVNSGYCFAGNAALFGSGDIRIATRESWIGLAGPAMIEAGGLGAFHPKDIGPAMMQAEIGLVDILANDDAEATQLARQALSYFQGDLATWGAADQQVLRHMIPEDRKRSYLVRPVVEALADTGSFLELGEHHANGLITGFLRIEGRAMAVMANNPHHLGGALDASASAKGADFLKLCSQFNLPVLSLCDTPGFMVGPQSETQGAVKAAADFIGAAAALNAPLIFVCLRKGYGIGAQAMAGGSFAAPACTLSWPTGEFGAWGLEGGVRLGYRKEISAEPSPEAQQALYDKLVAEAYQKGQAINVASLNEIDAVIDPADTRDWIVKMLRMNRKT
nr:carboxyl transferase domain-containing protein [Sedimentitalea sp. CY04]